uniref:BTB domain-containing protein n=1 Tax=Meloidogyne incognita TaxID=6306 RepID=A0A914KI65_MELIC
MIKSDEFPIDMEKCLHVEDDSLHLYCVVEYIPLLYEKEMELLNDLDKNHKAIDMSANNVKKSFTKMFEQGTLADFVIKVGDKELKTHRCVLANNSVVFKGMFKSNMVEAQTGELKIKDFSYNCVIAMIEFFYSGEINEDTFEELGENLFAIAHKYEVESLKEECERRMGSSINPTNFNKRYQCAKTYGLPMLEKACVKFIADNKKQFLFSEEWEKFESDNNKTACEMVKIAFCGEFSSDEN